MKDVLPPIARVSWPQTFRIIRSVFPPIDLFEDIADPQDWNALLSAESKTNPRLAETIGNLDLIPPERRVTGLGASYVMAPLTHVSAERTSRFADGTFGAYYAGDRFEVALFETIHHHSKFMARTSEAPGWTSQFRELIGAIDAKLHDIRPSQVFAVCLTPENHIASHNLARALRMQGSDGIVYPSVRYPEGECVAAFYPDVVSIPKQGRHLAYHWNGNHIDQFKDMATSIVYAVETK
jgi:RES domain